MKPQEAIGIMKIALAEVEWEYPMDYAAAFEAAIEAMEKQATSNYTSEWIPVSERLPNINSIVLVQRGTYAECKGKPIIDIAKFTNRKTGFFEREKGFYKAWYSMPFKYDDVIAWMPCPEPYKGESK